MRFEAKAIGHFLADCAGQVEIAGNLALADLQNAVKAIADGREAIPRPVPILVEPPALSAPKREVFFTLQPGMYVDANGTLQRVARFSFAELTQQQAAHALRMGGACAKDDPKVAQLRKQQTTQQMPEAHLCQDWDAGAEPIRDFDLWARHSSTGSQHVVFERHPDVGKPYTVKAPWPRTGSSRI